MTSLAAVLPATRPTSNWLVPHFEKMLYDNALLARVYLHAYQVTRASRSTGASSRRRWTLCVREMRHEDGGFYSSYDADSEGEEGKFYVWSADEIRAALGEEAALFMAAYGVSERRQLGGATSSTSKRTWMRWPRSK
jgi:uncharacterized protein YyaL (SSP411 family)